LIKKKYGSEQDVLIKFAPNRQYEYVNGYLKQCFTNDVPSIRALNHTYNDSTARRWLVIQLTDLCLYAGIEKKPTIEGLENIADTIVINYGFLKLTELMVFFQRFKGGKYGKFYGVIDGMVITEALNQFLSFRSEQINKSRSI
jgi:hypothetical protein